MGRPVRRNFYALMVKALTDLQAKAIGIEVMFEEPGAEYPEYDELLATTIAKAQRVVASRGLRRELLEKTGLRPRVAR